MDSFKVCKDNCRFEVGFTDKINASAHSAHNWPCKGLFCLVRGYLGQSYRLYGEVEALKHTFPCFSSVFGPSVLGETVYKNHCGQVWFGGGLSKFFPVVTHFSPSVWIFKMFLFLNRSLLNISLDLVILRLRRERDIAPSARKGQQGWCLFSRFLAL